jgi:hypothetical protein
MELVTFCAVDGSLDPESDRVLAAVNRCVAGRVHERWEVPCR